MPHIILGHESEDDALHRTAVDRNLKGIYKKNMKTFRKKYDDYSEPKDKRLVSENNSSLLDEFTDRDVDASKNMKYDSDMQSISKMLSYVFGIKDAYNTKTSNTMLLSAPPSREMTGSTEELIDITLEHRIDQEAFRRYETVPDFAWKKLSHIKQDPAHIENAWNLVRARLGFEGDCRYIWEKLLDTSLYEIILSGDHWVLPPLDSQDPTHHNGMKAAQEKLALVTEKSIKDRASLLAGKPESEVRNWGQEVLDSYMVYTKSRRAERLNVSTDIMKETSEILEEMRKVLRARKPAGLSAVFYNIASVFRSEPMIAPMARDENGKIQWADNKIDPRDMTPEQKKVYEEDLLNAMEEAYRAEMDHEEERICAAEAYIEKIDIYIDLLKTYRTELLKNTQSILAKAHPRAKESMAREIEKRKDVLEGAIQQYEKEIQLFELQIEAHKENKANLRYVPTQAIQRLRDQEMMIDTVMTQQNADLAGEMAKGLEKLALEKKIRIVTERIREQMAQQVDALVVEQEHMAQNEQTVRLALSQDKPVALIAQRTVLAIPAPSDEERGVVTVSNTKPEQEPG